MEEKKVEQKNENVTLEQLQAQLRALVASIEAARAELELIRQQIANLRLLKATLAKIKELGEGKTILVPVGIDAAIRAKIENPDTVVVTIGPNLSVELSYDEALKHIDKRISALEAAAMLIERTIAETYIALENLLSQAQNLEKEENK
ncbi:MAG TPA: prefoldin subunit alpha [Desulfurobacteriaceae bacterium]|nr:prefoldin subunit alpha [Desulfurobacteriaceae bacterium]